MSKYGVFSGPYFPVFGLNTEIYGVNICIQSEYRKIRTRKNSVFGHFSRSASKLSHGESLSCVLCVSFHLNYFLVVLYMLYSHCQVIIDYTYFVFPERSHFLCVTSFQQVSNQCRSPFLNISVNAILLT